MQTVDGKPTKTNEEIQAETDGMRDWVNMAPRSPEIMLQFALYERLGDIWMWAKERR